MRKSILKQPAAIRPFVGYFSALLKIAIWASQNKIAAFIGATTRQRDDVIHMVSSLVKVASDDRVIVTPENNDDFLAIDTLRAQFPDIEITPYVTISGYDNRSRAIKGKSEVRIEFDATPEIFIKARDAIVEITNGRI